MRTLPLAWFLPLVLLAPHADALEYQDRSVQYTDAPFSLAEAAGISLLTEVGAVEGNPDGTFRPNRTLNRAEFLKIALASAPNVRVALSDAENCFPDIAADAWYSRYVCLAKKRGIVSGYPDGMFRPENTVNYAEALKMLGELYGYTAYTEPDAPWYAVYAQAAADKGTALPVPQPPYGHALTRGQMARLAAAYRAEHEGELAAYRAAERGDWEEARALTCAECTESSSSVSSHVSQDSQQSSSSASMDNALVLPAESRQLLVGERSEPIADGIFTLSEDDAIIRLVSVRLDRKVDSLQSLILVAEDGTEIGTLSLKIGDTSDLDWRGEFEVENAYRILKDTDQLLALVAVLKPYGYGGFSGEIVEVQDWSITVQHVGTGQSQELVAQTMHAPEHQTVIGRVTGVRNALEDSATLQTGNARLIGAFTFTGATLSPAPLRIVNVRFQVEKSAAIGVDNWMLGIPSSPDRTSCTRSSTGEVNCLSISPSIGSFGADGLTLQLYADVLPLEQAAEPQTLRVTLQEPGTLGTDGAVWWSDGTQVLTWIEAETQPIAEGTQWYITDGNP